MADKEYYYKRIEATISELRNTTNNLKLSLDGSGVETIFSNKLSDAYIVDQEIESIWLDCLNDYKISHKLEFVDDFQKEEAALQYKDVFDNLLNISQDFSAEMKLLCSLMNSFKDIYNKFLKIFSEYDNFMTQYVDASWDSDNNPHPHLVLTPLELFYALTFLDQSAVRNIFAHVSPGILEDILNAYVKKDKNTFCNIVRANEIHPSNRLFDYMIAEIQDYSLSGLMKFFPIEASEFANLLDTMNNNGRYIFLEDLLNGTSSGMDKGADYDILNIFGDLIVRSIGECSIDPKIPLKFRNKFMALYNQARTVFTAIPDLSKVTSCKFENGIEMTIIERLRIDYIMKRIHEAMEADSGNGIREIEIPNKIPSDSRNLSFPTRLDKKITQSQLYTPEKIAVLTEIYNVFGGQFEDMTSEDFVYLFGASNKVPSTYNPPYYWCGDESTLKAILKVFYIRQPRLLRQLILHVSDKENGATGHDWGKNKDKVAYRDVEKIIIDIIHRLSGKVLKEL